MSPRVNIPPVTRIVLIALVLQSVLSGAIRYRQWTAQSHIVIPYLNLIPELSVLYPWTFLTTTFVESNIFTLGIACVTLYQGGRYLERAWSSREFAKFLLVASLIPNILTFVALLLFYMFTQNDEWTLLTIAGTIPLQISFLVAFSQLVPAHTVTIFRGLLSLRVPRFPVLYVLAVIALAMTPLLTAASVLLSIFGFLTSYTYLRFFKSVFPDLDSSQTTSLRGDASETFAFAEFFPGPLKPLVAAISDVVFNLLVSVHLCTPFSAADISARASSSGAGGEGYLHHQRSVPGSTRAEAERRRALALKALDQRLHAAAANAASRSAAAGPSGSSAAGPSSAGPSSSLPAATGPTVQTQPKADSQAAMTSPSGMLGETSYAPDEAGDKNHA